MAGWLRAFDQNWNLLGYRLNLDQQTRNWLKEAQGTRNRGDHLPPGVNEHFRLVRLADLKHGGSWARA